MRTGNADALRSAQALSLAQAEQDNAALRRRIDDMEKMNAAATAQRETLSTELTAATATADQAQEVVATQAAQWPICASSVPVG